MRYDTSMKTSYTRILAGLGVVLFGGLLLLDSLNIDGLGNILGTWWPLFVIGAGILIFLNDTKSYLWALLVTGLGIGYLLDNFNIIDFNPWQIFWPAVIIVVGLSILFRHSGTQQRLTKEKSDDVSAILGGIDHINKSTDYKGGKVTAVLGGVKLDLRKAVIKDEATLDVFSLMGGVELFVPENVVVKSKAAVIMGGIENKAQTTSSKNSPSLYITGDIIMAGVEVKS
ncbi:hypothetical protein EYC58_01690 [Candidatus Saccharibacteria bacterium]|nr:MAG: hypothetical protein EYC58_01690 [Candidatus Saccharibacteria bacterium]